MHPHSMPKTIFTYVIQKLVYVTYKYKDTTITKLEKFFISSYSVKALTA